MVLIFVEPTSVIRVGCEINSDKEKKIFLIEDAAPALGSYVKNKPVGSYGDFGCFSFHETKNLQPFGNVW